MRRILAALCAIALAGCATTSTAPGTIGKAVATPCQTSVPRRPAFAADALADDADIWTIGTALWSERKARQAYELELEVKLRGCVEPAPP